MKAIKPQRGYTAQTWKMPINAEIWRHIFDAIKDPAFLHDTQFRLLLANTAYCREAGVTEAQVLGKPYWEVFPHGTGPMPGCKDAIDRIGPGGSLEEVHVDEKLFLSRSYTARDEHDKSLYALHILSDITAQKHSEATRRKLKDLLQAVVENVPARIFWKDRNSHYLGGNTEFARDAGLSSPDQLGGKNDFEMVWKDRAGSYIADDLAVMESGKPKLDYEEQATRADGSMFWVRTSKVPLRDESSQIVGILGISHDITGRKQVEQELRASEQKFIRFFMQAPIPMAVVGNEGSIVLANEQFTEVLGYTTDDIPTLKEWWQLAYPDAFYRQEVMDSWGVAVARAARERTTVEPLECTVSCKSGAQRTVLISGIIVDDKVLATFIDITERKQAEQARADSEKRFRALIENATDGFSLLGMDGKLFYASPSTQRILGYAPETVVGIDPKDYTHPDDLESFLILLNELLQRPGGSFTTQYRFRHQDGSWRWLESTVSNLLAEPWVNAIVINYRDITERRQGELSLQRASRAMRTLSACNEALVRATDESGLLEAICRLIVETGGYRLAWVGFPEQDAAKTVRPVARYGFDDGFLAAANITWADTERGRGPTGTAMRTGAIQVDQNFLVNPALAPWREAALQRGYQSSIALPLKSAAGLLGTLTIYASEPDAFNEDEVILLQELAEDLAFGIVTLRTRAERDRIAHEQLHHVDMLRRGLQDSIKAIANTVEMRDPYTAGHQRRVGQLTIAIARELGMSEERIQGIGLAASIHDLGKISIPAEILSKPTRLTAIEFMLLKSHAQTGFDILKDIKFPWPIATMVLQHHERQDGSGYPQGLKGEQILLESRIMAVADVVEAMASHRPYREALGIDSALKEIERGRASVYDAAAVDACLRLFSEQRFSFSD